LSKKQEHVDRAVREEEIRAMSAPVSIPKRHGGHGDMLRRDSKKARRTFSKHDNKASNVSLPFADSIRSSMSGMSDQPGWAVSALDVFNPRPAVKVAGGALKSQLPGSPLGVSRNGSRKEKMPALKEDTNRNDRRKIADLADDMDATDIRLLMERDQKRRDKKKVAEQEKLQRSLQKRAEKQKIEDERRAREMGTPPPSAVHPAFRSKTEEKKPVTDDTIGQPPPTPMSIKGDMDATEPEPEKGGTYLKYGPEENPFNDPEDSPFADPVLNRITARRNRAYSDAVSHGASSMETPMETPFEDSVVETAQAVRLSQNRMSQLVPSPPQSPLTPTSAAAPMSPLRREYTPEFPAPPRSIATERSTSDISTKRTGTWASFFKRGLSSRPVDEMPPAKSEISFSNTSRESMSKQPIPAHLVGTMTKRQSAAPARTQSIFREDLPEINKSARSSQINAFDANMATQNVSKEKQRIKNPFSEPVSNGRTGRTDSPVDVDAANSAMILSTSLASIDSEGSWLSGRPSVHSRGHSQMRGSISSFTKKPHEFSGSFEDLGMPEEEFFRKLTPAVEPGQASSGAIRMDDGTLVRRDTNRRRPTLVQRDPRVKSREGLLGEFNGRESGGTVEEAQDEFHDEHADFRSYPQQIEYGRGHERKISSGSAKLLDIPPSRTRSGRNSPDNRTSVSGTPTASPRL